MKMNEFIIFLKDFYLNRNLILQLSKNDLKSRYSGSMFGITWAFVQPLVSILVFWFVFQVGFRNPPVGDIEFILWFVPAFVSWNYFSDALLTSSNSLQEYSYLVKKIKFRTSILPIIKVFSSTIIHLFFIIFLYLIFWIYGRKPMLIYLQLFYYMFSLMVLLIGLSWIVSSLSVFFKDFSQIVNIILQIGFWLTPVFWNPDAMSPTVLKILKLNPMYYIVGGYRATLIDRTYFWSSPNLTIYFWVVTISIFIFGASLYRRLRIHFADIL